MARKRTIRARRMRRILAASAIVAVAAAAAAVVWLAYETRPWTRDGRVGAQVSSMAPQVSGQIVELRITDNQFVRKGDVLYVIDPFDYRVAVDRAGATLQIRAADLEVKRVQAARREALTTVSVSIEDKQRFAGLARQAEASYALAEADLAQAKVDLGRTQVRSAVDGYVTNLLLRVGDFATTGVSNVSVVDAESYWVDGYFEETKMSRIRLGDAADIRLMGYARPLRGRVDSITRGISTMNATPSTQGLPGVDPVYTWVRLAQRVPVRIRIDDVPAEVPLVAGMTATIAIEDRPGGLGDLVAPLLDRIGLAAWTDPRRRAEPAPQETTDVRGAATTARIPAPAPPGTVPADRAAPGIAPGMTSPPGPDGPAGGRR
ncbi:HlyD family secretion protein [uncultured Methylobacterium sp.]|jgi:multidrug resistance efflux pump|uniref:biotin/lipoyl-binding protein n=1 Tax=uncultured Methylobacterium sp. TaxID=157278 RepID=UPI0026254C1F|nr:HlyD family secretion protein [uncultured Methylobacterium sp.]